MGSLTGKCAIVTGAGRPRGIGRGIALELAGQGASLVVTDLSRPRQDFGMLGLTEPREDVCILDEVVGEIEALGTRGLACPADVRSEDQVAACVDSAMAQFGNVDILVNCAGTLVGARDFDDLDDAAWQLSWEVNVMGAVRFARAVSPNMKARRSGAIVNISSMSGYKVGPGLSAYCATKFALVGLTKCLALDLGPFGIRCNVVCPGDIDTQMGDLSKQVLGEGVGEEGLKQIGLRRRGTPEDVAEAVAWLVGERCGYVNGSMLAVDGGLNENVV